MPDIITIKPGTITEITDAYERYKLCETMYNKIQEFHEYVNKCSDVGWEYCPNCGAKMEGEPNKWMAADVLNHWIGAEVLDKIRDEIIDIDVVRDEYSQRQNDYCDGVEFTKRYVLQIIDKYKAESEEV